MSKMARAYQSLIVNLPPEKFATMEATFKGREASDKSTMETILALSLIAPKEVLAFVNEGVFRALPSPARKVASRIVLTLARALAKLSGIKIVQPQTGDFKARPSDKVLKTTIAKDFKDPSRLAA